ncbi:hydroxyproline dehydrogenase-like isoform X2 [Tachypleus tridentatus]|uniref:hydroxyproline dehydrogenase-like isoform X2 n=1 Tax=Tachypleus tridentatus TaxID=6853 RepID=UPI003FD6807B
MLSLATFNIKFDWMKQRHTTSQQNRIEPVKLRLKPYQIKQIMNVMQKMCGPILLKVFVKPTLYNQFVAGETPGEFRNCVNRLKSANLRPFLGVTIESDVGEETRESTFDKNTQKILQCFDLSESLGVEGPFLQLKITGVTSADLIARLSDIYNQSSTATRQILVKNIAACISGQEMSMQPFDQLEPEERESLMLAVQRLKEIGQCASKKMVRVLVDAEYTYINPGLSLFTLAMMVAFNQQFPLIWNTYQCYLKKTFETASTELGIVENLGGCFGAKVVRGAYFTQERLRAVNLGYPSPICDTYEHTNQNYNRVVKYFLEHINLVGPRCNIIVATHNEESVQLAIERMREMNIDPLNGGVHFGQLYGMCDQISFPLASAGYAVYKCVPYGPLLEVLPFLARRAMENKGVLTGSRKEKTLLWQELKRRMKNMMRLKTKHDLKVETV